MSGRRRRRRHRRRREERDARTHALASKSEKLVACLPEELGRDREGKGEKSRRDEEDDDDERDRKKEREIESNRWKRKERRRESSSAGDRDGACSFDLAAARDPTHARSSCLPSPSLTLSLSFSRTDPSADSHECTNTSRDLKPLRLLLSLPPPSHPLSFS